MAGASRSNRDPGGRSPRSSVPTSFASRMISGFEDLVGRAVLLGLRAGAAGEGSQEGLPAEHVSRAAPSDSAPNLHIVKITDHSIRVGGRVGARLAFTSRPTAPSTPRLSP
jgi:hypothetical protein